MNLPPGPSGLKFYYSLFRARKDWLGFLSGLARDYGDVTLFRLFHVPVCFVNRPEYIESILGSDVSDLAKSRDYRPMKSLLGNGLLTSEGEFWRGERQRLQPAFHRERINAYSRVMAAAAEDMAGKWRDGEERDLHQDMMRLTLRIIAKTIFGTDSELNPEVVSRSMETAMERYLDLAWFAIFLPERLVNLGNRALRLYLGNLDKMVHDLIESRRKSARDGDGEDILSLLLEARSEDGNEMTDIQVRDEAMTLMLAGHETTANALTWTWVLLSRNPDAARKLHTELDHVLAGKRPQPEDMQRLRFTRNVIRESMRLYPPAWGIGREALREISIGGYRLPAGTNVYMSQWVTHRDPRYFDQPDRFMPERWTEDFEKNLPRFAYFPFGGGPRACIGASFATLEAALLLATIAQRFHFELTPGHPVIPFASVTLRPRHGVLARLRRRSARPMESGIPN